MSKKERREKKMFSSKDDEHFLLTGVKLADRKGWGGTLNRFIMTGVQQLRELNAASKQMQTRKSVVSSLDHALQKLNKCK